MTKKIKNTITINVELNEKKHPEKIEWNSTDNPNGTKPMDCKAMLVSFFDKKHLETYKIDLWTGELQVSEMDRFMYQTLRSMADTYFSATGNKELASDMQRFVQYFGEQTQIIPIEEKE
ncbi:MAG: gliding motility protein GldC [Saprospiraceae bacterium]